MSSAPPGNRVAELEKQLAAARAQLERDARARVYLEQLKDQSDRMLRGVIEELREAQRALQASAAELEGRVAERNAALARELEERAEAEERLRRRNDELSAMRDSAEAANRAKTAFLAKMSHELRTPLNAIIGYSELLCEEVKDGDVEPLTRDRMLPDLDKINSAAQQLMSVINDVLDIAKIESGRAEVHIEAFDLRDLARALTATIEPLALRNGNKLEVTLERGVGRIRSDRAKLRQTLLNLLSNACKFTKHGRVELIMRKRPIGDADWLHCDVTDNGIGIAHDKLGGLFEAFKQADPSTSSVYGGSGLGLAISREFCRMLGGELSATSELGVGSTFSIRVPVVTLDDADAPTQKPGHATHTVLVIDDDTTTHELLRRVLRRAEFDVHIASNGAEGLRMAEELQPDVITLDVKMSDMDGWSVLAALKADSELAAIPVIMVSMFSDPSLAHTLGADGYMTKPIDRPALIDLLLRYCEGATPRG
ncbi:MAG: response regulator [Myxococcales bacterium]|nr:response regulator [Myxococcales bacterium]MCB9752241.1 response regulator [Myxococcales bacterium]